MANYTQLIINPGSTSTKVAVYRDESEVASETIRHSAEELAAFATVADQYEFRLTLILQMLDTHHISAGDLDAIVVRGGLLYPMQGGTYRVNELMCAQLRDAVNGEHASNLGALIGKQIADQNEGVACYTADPVVVDELMDAARLTGLPEIERRSIFHALNQKAIARRAAADLGKKYADANLIVAHLGGGISVGAHQRGRVIDVNNALDGDGPITPERAGTVPAGQFAELCFSGRYTLPEVKKMLTGRGGIVAHLGTNDGREMASRVESGDQEATRVLKAAALSVAKEIALRAVALAGQIDAIVLTGSFVHFTQFVSWIEEFAGFLGPFYHYPGENEMLALMEAGLRLLSGEEEAKEYTTTAPSAPGLYQGKEEEQ
jgi:butyrate kinase